MISTVTGHYTSNSGLATSWRSSQQNQFLVVVVLSHEVALIIILSSSKEPFNCWLCFRHFFLEHNLIPTFHPSQHISIDILISQQIDESSRFILFNPAGIIDHIFFWQFNLLLVLLLWLDKTWKIFQRWFIFFSLRLANKRFFIVVHGHWMRFVLRGDTKCHRLWGIVTSCVIVELWAVGW